MRTPEVPEFTCERQKYPLVNPEFPSEGNGLLILTCHLGPAPVLASYGLAG